MFLIIVFQLNIGFKEIFSIIIIFVGNAFVKNAAPGTYDAMIVDSSDPCGKINLFIFIIYIYILQEKCKLYRRFFCD